MEEDRAYLEFAEKRLEARRATLRSSLSFICAACGKQKPKGQAAGVHLYKPGEMMLRKQMLDENGKLKVATYVICLECLDSLPDKVIHSKVTAYLGKAGLFGKAKEA